MSQVPARSRHQEPEATNLFGLAPAEIEELFLASGHARFHARQLARWMYCRGAGSFEVMTDLSRSLRAELALRFRVAKPRLLERHSSPRGEATKLLFELEDRRRIESVLLRNKDHHTICISSQAGCALNCTFCATGRIGLLRDLTPGEIVGQIAEIGPAVPKDGPAFNIVFMGMGEPMHNYGNVLKSIRLLADPERSTSPTRRITVSTSGFVPQIRMLAGERLHVGLAISLNATTDTLRSELMPINRRYPIAHACGGRAPLRRAHGPPRDDRVRAPQGGRRHGRRRRAPGEHRPQPAGEDQSPEVQSIRRRPRISRPLRRRSMRSRGCSCRRLRP